MTLEELQTEKRKHSEIVRSLGARIRQKKLEALHKKYGVTKGTRVTYRGGPFVVEEVSTWGYPDKPWLRGRLIKKDGTPGVRCQDLFSCWELE